MSGRRSPDPDRCPCHSGARYADCCEPLHRGRRPSTPPALMRARYAAYALGDIDFIIRTTHPAGPHWRRDKRQWRQDLTEFCRKTAFLGLKILAADNRGAQQGTVSFRATLLQNGSDASFTEKSLFKKEKGRWLYHSALEQEL